MTSFGILDEEETAKFAAGWKKTGSFHTGRKSRQIAFRSWSYGEDLAAFASI